MDETNGVNSGYQVPTYELGPDDAWYHFLYGNVPAHQIDFIYRPAVPQDPLTRQHFMHLSRIVKYIEPRPGFAYSFAITNLSRDDTQYEPGHGSIALVFGLRIKGVRDHAGRQNPPFCHSAALVDRHLDARTLYGIALQFYEKLLPDEESQAEGSGWYHTYVAHAENPDALVPLLKGYLADFADLFSPPPSQLGHRWLADDATIQRRIVVVYPDRTDFAHLAYAMARIAAVLIESDIKWTAISNGREQDVAGGLTVRFIPQRDAVQEPHDVLCLNLEEVPEDPAAIAAQLFHAHPVRMSHLPAPRMNFALTVQPGQSNGNGGARPARVSEERPNSREVIAAPIPKKEPPPAVTEGIAGLVGVVEQRASFESLVAQPDLLSEVKKKQRKEKTSTLIGTTLFILIFGVLGVVWFMSQPPDELSEPTTEKKPVIADGPIAIGAPGVSVAPIIIETAMPEPTNVPSTNASTPSTSPSVKKNSSSQKNPATKNTNDVLNRLPPKR